MKLNELSRYKNRQNSWQLVWHAKLLYPDLHQDSPEKKSLMTGFSTEGTFKSASMIPNHRVKNVEGDDTVYYTMPSPFHFHSRSYTVLLTITRSNVCSRRNDSSQYHA